MILKEKYDSFLQRLAAFYCAALAPITENSLSQLVPRTALMQLHDFFRDFYILLYEKSGTIIPNGFDDIYLRTKEHRSKNPIYKKAEDSVKPIIIDFLDFLYNSGQTGTVKDNSFIADKGVYEKYMSKKRREKAQLLEHLNFQLGLKISPAGEYVVFTNPKSPEMFQALSIFSKRCSENKNNSGRFCFFTCDYEALDYKYEPKGEDLISRVVHYKPEYSYILDLHNYMKLKGYAVSFKFEADIAFEIQYTNKKIKASPLLGISFDIRYEEPLEIRMRFVSTSRLAPIAGTLPDEMQETFYNDMGACRGAECGWCRNQKGLLHPSLLTVGDKQKSICWYAQKCYTKVSSEELETIYQYIKFHDQLLA